MAARRVLLIEDETGARDALGSLLAEEGYAVRTAASGRAGLACFHEFQPDTVVCDYLLPDIDGLRVMRQIRAAGGDTTFIMLTAGCGGDDAERTLREEADYFLGKPIDLAELHTLLQRAPGASPLRPHPRHSLNRKDRSHGRV